MIKPLLRIIPQMSGNVKLACDINDIEEINEDLYVTYIRSCSMQPLQNSLFNRRMNVNLTDGMWEYDVSKFYNKYFDTFFSENFIYNKNDYQSIEGYDNNINEMSRNKNYECGCKRISYGNTGHYFDFFAPIYITSADDLPDFFEIKIMINNVIKTLRVYINEDSKFNYLKHYLVKYLNKIDSNVIYINSDASYSIYYGINVKHGGLVQIENNKLYNIIYEHKPIEQFDNEICNGFKNNNIILRQVIPLSFHFNIFDILTQFEIKNFSFEKFKITASYYKNDHKLNFYDFDIDYVNKYVYDLDFDIDVSYDFRYTPRLKDNSYINLSNKNGNISKYSFNEYYLSNIDKNILTNNHCAWKMMLSPDDRQYVINSNILFTNPKNNTYGPFPIVQFNYDTSKKIINYDGTKNSVTTFIYDHKDEELDKSYYNMMKNTYYSTWYYLLNMYNDNKDIVNNWLTNSIFSDIKNKYAYFNGILYNFNKVDEIDGTEKFGIIMCPKFEIANDANIYRNIILFDKNLDSNGSLSMHINDNIKDITDNNIVQYNFNNDSSVKKYYNFLTLHGSYDDINSIKSKDDIFIDNIYFNIDDHELNHLIKVDDLISLLHNDDILTKLYSYCVIDYDLSMDLWEDFKNFCECLYNKFDDNDNLQNNKNSSFFTTFSNLCKEFVDKIKNYSKYCLEKTSLYNETNIESLSEDSICICCDESDNIYNVDRYIYINSFIKILTDDLANDSNYDEAITNYLISDTESESIDVKFYNVLAKAYKYLDKYHIVFNEKLRIKNDDKLWVYSADCNSYNNIKDTENIFTSGIIERVSIYDGVNNENIDCTAFDIYVDGNNILSFFKDNETEFNLLSKELKEYNNNKDIYQTGNYNNLNIYDNAIFPNDNNNLIRSLCKIDNYDQLKFNILHHYPITYGIYNHDEDNQLMFNYNLNELFLSNIFTGFGNKWEFNEEQTTLFNPIYKFYICDDDNTVYLLKTTPFILYLLECKIFNLQKFDGNVIIRNDSNDIIFNDEFIKYAKNVKLKNVISKEGIEFLKAFETGNAFQRIINLMRDYLRGNDLYVWITHNASKQRFEDNDGKHYLKLYEFSEKKDAYNIKTCDFYASKQLVKLDEELYKQIANNHYEYYMFIRSNNADLTITSNFYTNGNCNHGLFGNINESNIKSSYTTIKDNDTHNGIFIPMPNVHNSIMYNEQDYNEFELYKTSSNIVHYVDEHEMNYYKFKKDSQYCLLNIVNGTDNTKYNNLLNIIKYYFYYYFKEVYDINKEDNIIKKFAILYFMIFKKTNTKDTEDDTENDNTDIDTLNNLYTTLIGLCNYILNLNNDSPNSIYYNDIINEINKKLKPLYSLCNSQRLIGENIIKTDNQTSIKSNIDALRAINESDAQKIILKNILKVSVALKEDTVSEIFDELESPDYGDIILKMYNDYEIWETYFINIMNQMLNEKNSIAKKKYLNLFKNITDNYVKFNSLDQILSKVSDQIESYNTISTKYDDNLKITDILFKDGNSLRLAYYLIEMSINNYCYKVLNDNVYPILKIDNFELKQDETSKKIFISKYFSELLPLLDNNMSNNVITKLKTVEYPRKIDQKYWYISSEVQNSLVKHIDIDRNGKMNVSSDVEYKLEKRKYIQNNFILYRYFNYIEPILNKTTTLYQYNKIYKNTNIIYDKYNVYRELININQFNGLVLVNDLEKVSTDVMAYEKYIPYEYKHYNDNAVYLLPNRIEYTYNNNLTYEDLLLHENKEHTFNIFKHILKNKYNKSLDDQNEILFLFNKYDSTYESKNIKLTFDGSKKLYSLKYIFTLK